jgi:hypothetical protein
MQLSKNLTLSEVIASETAKRKGIENIPNAWQKENLICLAEKIFQPLRDAFCVPIFVSSGFRSIKLNKSIGGSATSQHCKGEAFDLDADRYGQITNKQIFDFIKENLEFDQLISEFGTRENPDWIHVSYSKDKPNRRETLRAYKTADNKTLYKKY